MTKAREKARKRSKELIREKAANDANEQHRRTGKPVSPKSREGRALIDSSIRRKNAAKRRGHR
jgi:hypothetical protein